MPTSPEKLATGLFWLESHQNEAFSPVGIRYLQLKKAAGVVGLTDEKLAYEKELPKLLVRFHNAISSIACDVIVQCPSCEPHAGEFAGEAAKAHPKATHLVLAYDCNDPNRPRSGRGASVDQLAKAIRPDKRVPGSVRTAKQVLIVDDVYSEGKTAAAVAQKLWEWGLDRSASFCLAVALRVISTRPAQKFDLSEVLTYNRSSARNS